MEERRLLPSRSPRVRIPSRVKRSSVGPALPMGVHDSDGPVVKLSLSHVAERMERQTSTRRGCGWLSERSKETVLKTVRPSGVSRVRISHHPPPRGGTEESVPPRCFPRDRFPSFPQDAAQLAASESDSGMSRFAPSSWSPYRLEQVKGWLKGWHFGKKSVCRRVSIAGSIRGMLEHPAETFVETVAGALRLPGRAVCAAF